MVDESAKLAAAAMFVNGVSIDRIKDSLGLTKTQVVSAVMSFAADMNPVAVSATKAKAAMKNSSLADAARDLGITREEMLRLVGESEEEASVDQKTDFMRKIENDSDAFWLGVFIHNAFVHPDLKSVMFLFSGRNHHLADTLESRLSAEGIDYSSSSHDIFIHESKEPVAKVTEVYVHSSDLVKSLTFNGVPFNKSTDSPSVKLKKELRVPFLSGVFAAAAEGGGAVRVRRGVKDVIDSELRGLVKWRDTTPGFGVVSPLNAESEATIKDRIY